jgi:sirohydrochlorin cobaltochelatase
MNNICPTSEPSIVIREAEDRLDTLLPGIYRGRINDVKAVSMGSAPLAFDVEGNVEWDRMWQSFCDLAMAGGPPHKGKLLLPGSIESIMREPQKCGEVCDEIIRGIALAARLQAEPSDLPGWIRVRCKNEIMAEWMLRAITMENVAVQLDSKAILLPVGPAFRVEKEIKNVITVAAKTAHYWTGHLIRLQQLGIAALFRQLEVESPLLQPMWDKEPEGPGMRSHIKKVLEEATGLRVTDHSYSNWIGLDCQNVATAISAMRRIVASNILCRREDTALFLPVNAHTDPRGERLLRVVVPLLEHEEGS